MTDPVNPCPHVCLRCGSCPDCCECTTGELLADAFAWLRGEAAKRGAGQIIVIEEEKYWLESDGKPSPATEALRRLIWQGRDPGIPGFRFELPGHHGKTVNLPEADG